MAESVIIVACALGALAVVAIVGILIYCISSPDKDHVTTLRPRPREQLHSAELPRRLHVPKPPPYSEAPPAYEAIETIEISTRNIPRVQNTNPVPSTSRPNSTRDGRATPHPSATSKNRRQTALIVDTINNTRENSKRDHHHSNLDGKMPGELNKEENRPKSQKLKMSSSLKRRLSEKNKIGDVTHDRRHDDESDSKSRDSVDTEANNARTNVPLRTAQGDNLPGLLTLSASPVPTTDRAAARSSKRRAILETLQRRQEQRQEIDTLYMI